MRQIRGASEQFIAINRILSQAEQQVSNIERARAAAAQA